VDLKDDFLAEELRKLRVLAEPLGMRIVLALRDRGPLSVGELVQGFSGVPVAQSAVSGALNRLGRSGIVFPETTGSQPRYCLNQENIRNAFVIAQTVYLSAGEIDEPLEGEEKLGD